MASEGLWAVAIVWTWRVKPTAGRWKGDYKTEETRIEHHFCPKTGGRLSNKCTSRWDVEASVGKKASEARSAARPSGVQTGKSAP
jgi:hypothetical protein